MGKNHSTFKGDQFTGLQDRNGVDIYERDIIRVSCGGYDHEFYQVAWHGDESYPAFDLAGWEGEANGLSEISCGNYTFEVIGNIYENPELLDVAE